MLRSVLCVTALIGTATMVMATMAVADGIEGSVKDTPVAADSYVWKGLYAGIGIGAGSFDHDGSSKFTKKIKDCQFDAAPSAASVSVPVDCKPSDSHTSHFGDDDWDVFGTLQLGYDRIVHSHIVVGVFADVDIYPDSDLAFSDTWETYGSISGQLDLEHVWNVGGRLGYLITPRILIYGVGGYSEASVDGSVVLTPSDGAPTTVNFDGELRGYFLGAGGEIKLDRTTSVKFEYRWADYDGDGGSAGGSGSAGGLNLLDCGVAKVSCPPTKTLKGHADLDAEIHSARVALVFRLDEPAAPVAPLK